MRALLIAFVLAGCVTADMTPPEICERMEIWAAGIEGALPGTETARRAWADVDACWADIPG